MFQSITWRSEARRLTVVSLQFLQYVPHWGTKYHQIHREDDDDRVKVVAPTYHVFRVEQPITRGCGVEVLQDINTAVSSPLPIGSHQQY